MSAVGANKEVEYVEAHFGISGLSFIPASSIAPSGWGEGDPTDPAWVDPLGIPGATNPISALRYNAASQTDTLSRRLKFLQFNPGNQSGRVTYETPTIILVAVNDSVINAVPTRSIIYKKGKKVGQSPAGSTVSDMVIYEDDDGVSWLWAVCIGPPTHRNKLYSYRIRWTGGRLLDENWELLGQIDTASFGASCTDQYGVSHTILRVFNNASINASKDRFCVFMYPSHPSGAPNSTLMDLFAGVSENVSGYIVSDRDMTFVQTQWNLRVDPAENKYQTWSTSYEENAPQGGTFSYEGKSPDFDASSPTFVFDVYYDSDTLKFCSVRGTQRVQGHSYKYVEVSDESGRVGDGSGSGSFEVEYLIDFGFLTLRDFSKSSWGFSFQYAGSFSGYENEESEHFGLYCYDLKNKVVFYSKNESNAEINHQKEHSDVKYTQVSTSSSKTRDYLYIKNQTINLCDEISTNSTYSGDGPTAQWFYNNSRYLGYLFYHGLGAPVPSSGTFSLVIGIVSGSGYPISKVLYEYGYPRFRIEEFMDLNDVQLAYQYYYPRDTYLNYDFYKGRVFYSIAYGPKPWLQVNYIGGDQPLYWVINFENVLNPVSFVGVQGSKPRFNKIGRF
jgi:hypothetical protein